MRTSQPKIACFITARTDSSRLPRKMLLKIRGRTVIEHVIYRAKLAKKIDSVILCTSDRPEDDILAGVALNSGILCFRGSLNDKLSRWLGAAERFNVDYFITFDGDDLFCDPELIELAAGQIRANRPDFLRGPAYLICGSFTYGISREALKKVCEIKGTNDTEMQSVYFTDTGLFNVEILKVKDDIFFKPNIRMTLDYKEDFEFFSKIFDEFNSDFNATPLRKILELIGQKPELAQINFFRQKDYLDNQKKMIKLILKES